MKTTALHNHFAFDRPPVYFMHIGGTGDDEMLATGEVRSAGGCACQEKRSDGYAADRD